MWKRKGKHIHKGSRHINRIWSYLLGLWEGDRLSLMHTCRTIGHWPFPPFIFLALATASGVLLCQLHLLSLGQHTWWKQNKGGTFILVTKVYVQRREGTEEQVAYKDSYSQEADPEVGSTGRKQRYLPTFRDLTPMSLPLSITLLAPQASQPTLNSSSSLATRVQAQ